MKQIELGGGVGVITGGARGIGLAVAERLQHSGAKVALWDSDGKRAASSAGQIAGADAREVDVTAADGIAAALAATERALGPVDILVTSAGITGPNATVAEYPVA